jgi:acetyl-CoA C-acetyltransferase
MKAIALAPPAIKAGDNEVVVAGGMENMSDVPHRSAQSPLGTPQEYAVRQNRRPLMVFDARLYEIFYGYHMGITAENIAARYAISREEQDKLSLEEPYPRPQRDQKRPLER